MVFFIRKKSVRRKLTVHNKECVNPVVCENCVLCEDKKEGRRMAKLTKISQAFLILLLSVCIQGKKKSVLFSSSTNCHNFPSS